MISIRKARQFDLENIVRLHKESLDTFSSKIGENYLGMFYSFILNDQKNYLVLLAEDKTDILGVISITKNMASTKDLLFKRGILFEIIKSLALFKVSFSDFLNYFLRAQMVQRKVPKSALYIMTLFVKSSYKGKGIGTKLVEKSLKGQEGPKVFVDTLSTNRVAQKFYGSLGFRKVAKILDSELLIYEK